VLFLDVSAAQVSPVVSTVEAFGLALCEPAFVDLYLCRERVEELRRNGKVLNAAQIYSYRVPLSLGGQTGSENVEITDVYVHFALTGQIERQIADMPAGTPVSAIKFDTDADKKPWWRFW